MMHAAVADCRQSPRSLRLTAVPSFAARLLAPRLASYHQRADAAPIQIDVSIEVRKATEFDMAIRTGRGNWPDFESTQLMPVDITPMLSPALAASVKLNSPADLASLPLLPHGDWPHWFRRVNVRPARLRFCADEYSTYELDAAAAIAGTGVALLSPRLFASLLREGKLVQPFAEVMRGPIWHYLLLKPGERRTAVRDFRAWLQQEVGEHSDAAPSS